MASTELLVIIGELLNVDQVELLGQGIVEGLKRLKLEDVNLCDELRDLANATPQSQKDADTVVPEIPAEKEWLEFSSDKLVTKVLFRPSFAFLSRHLQSLFGSENSRTHKCLVYSGLVADGSGDWFLSDSTYSADNVVSKLRELDVQKQSGEGEEAKETSLHVVCPQPDAEWMSLESRLSTRFSHVRVNGEDSSTEVTGLVQFAAYLSTLVKNSEVEPRLESSPIMGMLRFSRPAMYIFPEGAGDACLLGVNGFNLLVNSGASKEPSFWNFIRHLDKIDAVMMTHWSYDNLLGLTSFVERKTQQASVGPPMGCFLGPPGPGKGQMKKSSTKPPAATENGREVSLVVNMSQELNSTLDRLRQLDITCEEIKAPPAAAPSARGPAPASSGPIILYLKVGHGSLELHPLTPPGDSKEVKDMVAQWAKNASKFTSVKIAGQNVPLPQALSLCALLIWRPSRQTEPVLRVLYPGASHQARIFEQLEKVVKTQECLRHPTYVPSEIAAAAAAAAAAAGAAKKKPPADAIRKEKAPAGTAASAKPASTPRRSAAPAKDTKDARNGVKSAPPSKDASSKRPTSASTAKPAPKPAPSKAPPSSARKPADAKTPRASTTKSTTKPASAAAKPKGPPAKKTSTPPSESPAPAEKLMPPPPTPPAAAEEPPKASEPAPEPVADPTPAPPTPPTQNSEDTSEPVQDQKDAPMPISEPEPEPEPTPAPVPAEEPVNQLIDLEPPVNTKPTDNAAVEPLLDMDGHLPGSGDPEGLPAPTEPVSSSSHDSLDSVKAADADEMLASASMTDSLYLKSWGAPQHLPPPPASKRPTSGRPSTAGAGRKSVAGAEKEKEKSYGPVVPCYLDLAYIPNHGDIRSADVEFFKRVRAKFYVLSAVDPNPLLLDAVLEGKESWGEEAGTESTTLIPTYDNDTVLAWMEKNKERLETLKVVLAPSAHRCTIQLQDQQDAVCTAYRVEF